MPDRIQKLLYQLATVDARREAVESELAIGWILQCQDVADGHCSYYGWFQQPAAALEEAALFEEALNKVTPEGWNVTVLPVFASAGHVLTGI